jgi:hypothetical protein
MSHYSGGSNIKEFTSIPGLNFITRMVRGGLHGGDENNNILGWRGLSN